MLPLFYLQSEKTHEMSLKVLLVEMRSIVLISRIMNVTATEIYGEKKTKDFSLDIFPKKYHFISRGILMAGNYST